MLSGGKGDRIAEGLRLWRAGVARTLVLSDGRSEDEKRDTRHCDRPRTLCFVPDPYSTQGESRWVGLEARRRGWESLLVVTSAYHVRRARMVFGRCFGGRLAVVGSDPPLENLLIGVAWEWPKGLYYLTLKRGC